MLPRLQSKFRHKFSHLVHLLACAATVTAVAASPATEDWGKLMVAGQKAIEKKDFERARLAFSRALEIAGGNKMMRRLSLRHLADAYRRKGSYAEAIQLYQEEINSHTSDDGAILPSVYGLSQVYGLQGNAKEQEASLLRAQKIFQGRHVPQSSAVEKTDIQLSLIELYVRSNRFDDAISMSSEMGTQFGRQSTDRKPAKISAAITNLTQLHHKLQSENDATGARTVIVCVGAMVEAVRNETRTIRQGEQDAKVAEHDQHGKPMSEFDWQMELTMAEQYKDLDSESYISALSDQIHKMRERVDPHNQVFIAALKELAMALTNSERYLQAWPVINEVLVLSDGRDGYTCMRCMIFLHKLKIMESTGKGEQIPQLLPEFDRMLSKIKSANDIAELSGYAERLRSVETLPVSLALLSRQIAQSPNSKSLRLRRIEAMNYRGKYAEMRPDLEKACQIAAGDPIPFFLRGNYYWRIGQNAQAILDYSRALKLGHTTCDCWAGRGHAYLSSRNYDLALADFKRAIKASGVNYNAFWGLGLAYSGQKNYAAAWPFLDSAVKLAPDVPAVLIDRAWCAKGLGNIAQAMADRDKALRLAPKDATIQQRCLELTKALGLRGLMRS